MEPEERHREPVELPPAHPYAPPTLAYSGGASGGPDAGMQSGTPVHVLCVGCQYDLTGTAVGQACPECGTPVATTFGAYKSGMTSGIATACMIVGICSMAVCGLAGPVAIVLYSRAKRQMANGGYSPGSHSVALVGFILGVIATGITALGGIVVLITVVAGL